MISGHEWRPPPLHWTIMRFFRFSCGWQESSKIWVSILKQFCNKIQHSVLNTCSVSVSMQSRREFVFVHFIWVFEGYSFEPPIRRQFIDNIMARIYNSASPRGSELVKLSFRAKTILLHLQLKLLWLPQLTWRGSWRPCSTGNIKDLPFKDRSQQCATWKAQRPQSLSKHNRKRYETWFQKPLLKISDY